jgi:hypothetical protein
MLQGRRHGRETAWRRGDELHQEVRIRRNASGSGTEELIAASASLQTASAYRSRGLDPTGNATLNRCG